ncbi:hypothetical protein AMTR_s00048p00137500 [Amborella trichopoda]|uniref:Uncharacterized protein n=1 Tax=Amborella trichopoda TaxID=13333 RepID=U5D023_AMBTC|nr:hypothetical protein AMTR_s00048p00137500 [Amborella trichopoda]
MGLKKFFTPPTVLPLLRLLTLILVAIGTVIIATNSIDIGYWNLTYRYYTTYRATLIWYSINTNPKLGLWYAMY